MMLDAIKEPFDHLTGAIQRQRVGYLMTPMRSRGNHRNDRLFSQHHAQRIPVVASVGNQGRTGLVVEPRPGLSQIMVLTGRDRKGHRVPLRIDDDMDLGRQAASRAAQRLIRGPPFAPAAC